MAGVKSSAGVLILLRHGQSTANAAGIFTGALDVPLTERGIREAQNSAALLNAANLAPACVFTSPMLRARQTTDIVTRELRTAPSIVHEDWRLNERNYGALTSRSKEEVRREFGEEQFLAWRRSADTAPPPMSDELYAELSATKLFCALPREALARTEALTDVIERVGAFYAERVHPLLEGGASVLLVAHGNSLRALCAVLDDLSDEAIRRLNLPTGQPLIYSLGTDGRPENSGGRYLDQTTAKAAALALSREGGT